MTFLERLLPAERTCDARYGRVTYLARDAWHGRAFRLYGEWSEAEVALWRRLVRPGDVAVDVGAHLGAHALALAALVGPAGRVHAFEPQARIADLLERNAAQNRRENVYVNRVALGDGSAEALWYDRPAYGRAGNFGGVELRKEIGTDTAWGVDARTLDSFNLPALGFLKVDVEGAEVEVLNGARDTIKRCRPIVYAENDRPDRSAQLLRILGFLGYKVLWHLPPLFNPANFKQNPVNVFGPTVSVNVLALPRERYADLRAAASGDPHLYALDTWRYNAAGQLARG